MKYRVQLYKTEKNNYKADSENLWEKLSPGESLSHPLRMNLNFSNHVFDAEFTKWHRHLNNFGYVKNVLTDSTERWLHSMLFYGNFKKATESIKKLLFHAEKCFFE